MANGNVEITEGKYPKPTDCSMRRPEALERGKCYKLSEVCREKSKYRDKKTGNDVWKTLAVFEEFSMKFYVYLPWKFDNKPDTYFDKINKDIKDGLNIRIVYYGKLSNAYMLEMLAHNEGINQEKLSGIRKIEQVEAGESPSKRIKTEVIDD